MGNGALPNGPSYRAHPQLYLFDLRAAPTNVRSWELNGLNADVAFWAVHGGQYLSFTRPRPEAALAQPRTTPPGNGN